MFRIKICGVTNVEDAVAAVDAGADAVGLNFYEKSPRCVSLAEARSIVDAIVQRGDRRVGGDTPGSLPYPTGVFVNHPPEYICHVYEAARLAAAQLHGDEPAAILGKLLGIPVVRVRRLDAGGLAAVADDLAACRAAVASDPALDVASPSAVLLDAAAAGQYGGTGARLPWEELADYRRWLGDTPLILAGGLTPDNVAEAIRIVRPHGVDVASGVESSPGRKDVGKVRDFVAAAREGLGGG